jgi:PAS domain S-box-containing protein
VQDITERQQAEQLRRQLAAIVESTDDAVIGLTLDGAVTSWNRGAERLYGYTAAEVIGRSVTVIVPPDRRGEDSELLARIARGEHCEPFDTKRLRKDGALIDVLLSYSPTFDEAGNVVAASSNGRDITDRLRAEAALRASEAQLASVINSTEDMIMSVDRDLQVMVYNDTLRDAASNCIAA